MNIRKLIKIAILIGIATIIAVFLLFYRPVSLAGDTLYEPVYTGSMEPAIPVGSVVVIKPVNTETLKEGDIICFPSILSHTVRNPGKEKAIGFAVVSPPTFM